MAGRAIYSASFPKEFMESAWMNRGYYGDGAGRCNIISLIDSLEGKTAIVVGSGGTTDEIFEDYYKALDKNQNAVVFAVNDIGVYLPTVHHLVSLHEDKLAAWARLRKHHHNRNEFATHALIEADWNWEGIVPVMPISGYFAMQIAWVMGAQKIVLVGCPGDNTRRFFDRKARDDFHYQEQGVLQQLLNEMNRLPDFKAAVRSMSGMTKEFFGGDDG
jgi:hypothetical protein